MSEPPPRGLFAPGEDTVVSKDFECPGGKGGGGGGGGSTTRDFLGNANLNLPPPPRDRGDNNNGW